uniref:Alpha-mannosidase n=1 Tax=Kwoniella bestiolae CBS 10118 TaxID=1296100 RepID=A0A1B9GGU0_9TREE|nr:alpha-mannosidase [Kwoniella bestiolae CBS 10118]OCF30188.1 alpha-mannosidase [Kwoniella bestiolae CBS 10118]
MSTYDTTSHKKGEYPQRTDQARYKHLGSTHGRLDQFIGGHYADYNLSSLLFAHRLDDSKHVKLEVWSTPNRSKPSFEEAKRQNYRIAHKGEEFGPSWTNHWFRITLHIPPEFKEYERIQFEFDPSGEGLIYTVEGNPIHGLTGGFKGDRRVEFIIPQDMRDSGVAHFYIEASCNGMFGIDDMDPPDPNRYYRLNSADLVVPNMEAWRLMWDFNAIHQVYNTLPDDSPLSKHSLYVANEIMNTFKRGSLESVGRCRKLAEEILGKEWEKEVGKDSKDAEKQKGTLWGVGHCHIDTAWLWPFSVTQQKSARSWSTQCDLIDRYPEHRFSATQAQQFKWTEELYPTLFARIKSKVSEGSFQPLGATWVEMDTNMPSGEALVRQFLYGQRYYQSRFGFRAKTFVLPDTFGYSSQLPQISRQAGAPNFFTQKLSWNSINNFPHTTFNWVGLDGSQVLTHMTPVDNYNSQCDIGDIRRGMTGHKNLEVSAQSLLLFGNGDGGGGPTPPMLERLRRARAIGKRSDAGGQLPLVKMGGSFDEFYDSVRKETDNATKLPYWRGELYFELHRGTYTSHASIKKGNRKSEILMREAEYAATIASLIDPDYEYPKKRLDAAWEDLLLCQFHDVLPGSGIAMIYEDAEKKYASLQSSIHAVLNEAYSIIYHSSFPISAEETTKIAGPIFAVNNIPDYPRQEVISIPIDSHPQIESRSAQISKDGQTGYLLVATKNDEDAHEGSMLAHPRGLYANPKKDDLFIMANSKLSMKIENGRITSIYDRDLEQELLPHGQTGGLVIMEDHPNYWEDVDEFHLEKQTHLKFESVHIKEEGPLRVIVGASLQIGQSRVEVNISMDAIAASLKADARSMLRFDAVIDWREKHQFLKFELPLDIYSDFATYDTQFGTVARPTHRNTTWDAAKFEVCSHKFADLSEYGYGVAILNDCKYGYATHGNIIRLSLLRAPTQPDADCDMGTHSFSFAIYPHKGTFVESDVAQVAYAFNTPMRLRYSKEPIDIALEPLALQCPFKLENAPNVMLETIKRGEDDGFSSDHGGGHKTIILRLYEHLGGHARAALKITGLNVVKAELVNILEDHLETLKLHPSAPAKKEQPKRGCSPCAAEDQHKEGEEDHDEDKKKPKDDNSSELRISFRGYEIKTVRLTVESSHKGKRGRRGSECSWVKV